MYFTIDVPADAPPPDTSVVQIMSLVHLILAGSLLLTASVVYNLQFSPERLEQALTQDSPTGAQEPPQRCIGLIRTAMIIRLALYEGIALFGLVACLLAVVENVVQVYPVYWLNLLSALFVLGYVVMTLPTKSRITRVFVDKIKKGNAGLI